jgi:hypothetical protein
VNSLFPGANSPGLNPGVSNQNLGERTAPRKGYQLYALGYNGTPALLPYVAASSVHDYFIPAVGDNIALLGSAAYDNLGAPNTNDRVWVSVDTNNFDPSKAFPMAPGDARGFPDGFSGLVIRLAAYPPKPGPFFSPPAHQTNRPDGGIDLIFEVSAGYNSTPGGISSPTTLAPVNGQVGNNVTVVANDAIWPVVPGPVYGDNGTGTQAPNGQFTSTPFQIGVAGVNIVGWGLYNSGAQDVYIPIYDTSGTPSAGASVNPYDLIILPAGSYQQTGGRGVNLPATNNGCWAAATTDATLATLVNPITPPRGYILVN